jgi:hypothetical protein
MNRCIPDRDFEKVIVPRRAVFLCATCRRDVSLEYLFWAEAAHPEWLEQKEDL